MNSQFNAIEYSQQLQNVGVSRVQAETHAKLLSDALANCAATRADLSALEEKLIARMDTFEGIVKLELAGMRVELSDMRAEMRGELANMRAEIATMRGDINLNRWMSSLNLALLIALIAKSFYP